MRRFLRISKWIGMGLGACILLVALGSLVLLQTRWGNNRLRVWTLAQLQPSFCGPVQLQEIRISGWLRVEAFGIRIQDCAGHPALEAEHAQVQLGRWPDWKTKTFFVSRLGVEGARVGVVQGEQGTWNWSTLLKKSSSATPASPSVWTWQVEQVRLQAVVQVRPSKTISPESLQGRIQVQGKLTLTPRSIVWSEGDVMIDWDQPGPVQVHVQGGGRGSGSDLLEAGLHFHSPGLQLEVRAEASLLRRWFPALVWAGPVLVKGFWKGGVFHSTLTLDIASTALRLHMEGGTDLEGLSWGWKAKLQSQEIQPHLVWGSLPIGKSDLEMEAKGSWSQAEITLKRFSWRGEQASMTCHGQSHWRKGTWSHAEAHAQAVVTQMGSLAPLLPLGWKGQGSMQADAVYEGTWNIQGQLQGKNIQGPELFLGEVQAQVNTRNPNILEAMLQNVRVGDFGFVRLQTTAQKQPLGVAMKIEGKGLHGVGLGVELQIKPQHPERLWEDWEIAIPRFFLRRLGQKWALSHPAFIELQTGKNWGFRIRNFLLSLEKQRVSLEGFYESQGDAMDLQVDVQRLDLRKAAQFFYRQVTLPTTNFHFRTHLHGSLLHPQGTVELFGNSRYFDALQWQPATYKLTATVGEGRVRGTASAQTQGGARTSLLGEFDVPFSTQRSLRLKVAGKVPLALLRPLLPPGWDGVLGSVAVNLQARGTLQRPTMELLLNPDTQARQKIGASAWSLQPLEGTPPFLSMRYDGEVIFIDSVGSVQDSTQQPLGTWRLEGVQVPLSWEALVWERKNRTAWLHLPLAGKVQLQQVHGRSLMRVLQQANLPLQEGVLNASLELGGTWQNPSLRMDATVDQLHWRDNPAWEGGSRIQITYLRDQIHVQTQGWLQGHALWEGTADMQWALMNLLETEKSRSWWSQPLRAEVTLQETFPWDTLFPVQGKIGATLHLQGSFAQPKWLVEASGKQVAWEGGTLGTVSATLFPRDANSLTAHMAIAQSEGGSLKAEALIPWPFVWEQALLQVHSHRFAFSYQASKLQEEQPLQALGGEVDADAEVHWKFHRPQVTGTFSVHKGSLGLNTSSRFYRDLELAAEIKATEDPRQVRVFINRLTTAVGSGQVTLSGIARMEGWKTISANLLLQQERFPLSQGTLGAWLDAQTQIHADTEGNQLRVTAKPLRAHVQLPSLSSGESLHPLARDANVGFVDQRQEKNQESSFRDSPLFQLLALYTLPERTHVELLLPEPIPLEGPRLQTKITGSLVLDVDPEKPVRLDGYVRSVRGTVQLFGKSYDIHQGQVRLEGPVSSLEPQLFVQLTRPVPQATLIVEASGPLSNPATTLRTDPSVYNQSQLLTLFAGSDSAEDMTQPEQQGRDAVGLISGLVLAQARQAVEQGVDTQTSKALQILLPDTLKIGADPNSSDLLQSSRLEIGKSLVFPDYPRWSHLIYIGFSYQPELAQSLKRQNSQQVNVALRFLRNVEFAPKWQFWRNLQIDSLYGNENIARVDLSLHWRLDKKPEEKKP